MTAGPWQFTDSARTKILNNTFRITADTWKCALFLSTSNIGVASTSYVGVTNEHANANGYLTGGVPVTFTLSGTTDVDVAFTTNPIWAASGGNIVARYAAIYEVGGDVLCVSLLDTTPGDVTITDGSVFLIDGDGSPTPVFDVT